MCTEKNLNQLRLTYLDLKSIRGSYFVPIIAIFVYIPVMIYLNYLTFGNAPGFLESVTFHEMQRVIPFFSIWWILFGLREHIEGDGVEVLRANKKSITKDFLIILFWYILHAILFTVIVSFVFRNYFMEFLVIICQILVFSSVSYIIMILTKTISLSFLLCTIYEVFVIFSEISALSKINMFKLEFVESTSDLLLPYLPLFIISIILIFVADYFYKAKPIK